MGVQVPRISSATVTGPTSVAVEWMTGGSAHVDLIGWIGTGAPILAPLVDPRRFASATVSEHGSGLTWDGDEGDLGIDAHHLALLAEEQMPFGSSEAADWQKVMAISNSEAAELLGVAASTWSTYKAGNRIPKAVAMLCRATRRDPILMQAFFRPRRPRRPTRPSAAA